MKTCVIFDLGNVLVKFNLHEFAQILSEQCNESPENLISYPMRSGLTEKYDSGIISDHEFYKELKNKFEFSMEFEEFSIEWNKIFVPQFDMLELIKKLNSAGIYTALLSNTCPLHFEFLNNTLNLDSLLKKIFVSYKMNTIKPRPEIYKKTLSELKIPPENILFVDDLEENIKGFEKFGVSGHVFKEINILKEDFTKNKIPF